MKDLRIEILKYFENDDETEIVMITGKIDGPQYAEVGEYFPKHINKPLAAYILGLTTSSGRKMGYAGAIVSSTGESAAEKVVILKDAGIMIATSPPLLI